MNTEVLKEIANDEKFVKQVAKAMISYLLSQNNQQMMQFTKNIFASMQVQMNEKVVETIAELKVLVKQKAEKLMTSDASARLDRNLNMAISEMSTENLIQEIVADHIKQAVKKHFMDTEVSFKLGQIFGDDD